MWKYAALISYVGTDFCGWQKQRGSAALGNTSIQQTLEASLEKMTGESVSVVGSGRTDSGVHAVGQVAHFKLSLKEWDPNILQKGLNSLLPMTIRVLEVVGVPFSFHAQRSALQKQYSYYFQQGSAPLPHLEPHSWWIRKTLDVEKMSAALHDLVGEHDFKPFRASGAKPGPSVRRILEAEITVLPAAEFIKQMTLVRVRLVGTGFLKQMVRGIAGTLLQVGEGRRSPLCMREILESQDRSKVGPTAPARALWLEKVWYSKEWKGEPGLFGRP